MFFSKILCSLGQYEIVIQFYNTICALRSCSLFIVHYSLFIIHYSVTPVQFPVIAGGAAGFFLEQLAEIKYRTKTQVKGNFLNTQVGISKQMNGLFHTKGGMILHWRQPGILLKGPPENDQACLLNGFFNLAMLEVFIFLYRNDLSECIHYKAGTYLVISRLFSDYMIKDLLEIVNDVFIKSNLYYR